MKYKMVYRPKHPRASPNGMVPNYILVVEKELGRSIEQGEIVHHLNYNKEDDSPENLMVLGSKREHQSIAEAQVRFLENRNLLQDFAEWYKKEYKRISETQRKLSAAIRIKSKIQRKVKRLEVRKKRDNNE